MNRRELIRSLIGRRPASRFGFWLGNPHPDVPPRNVAAMAEAAVE